VIRWDCDPETGWVFELGELVVEIENIGPEPVNIRVRNLAIHRTLVDALRRRLRHILAFPLEERGDMQGFAMILLRVVEEAVSVIVEWNRRCRDRVRAARKEEEEPRGWNVKDINYAQVIKSIYENPYGASLDSIDNSGDLILGSSIKDICEQFPDEYRILHVEPVFRDNLVNRFRQRQNEMLEDMKKLSFAQLRQCVSWQKIRANDSRNNKDDLAAELCKPVVTFHGTSRYVVSSIVRHGFVKPGDKIGEGKELEIRCGASYGVGIYSSPSPDYALWYSNMSWEDQEITRVEDIPGMRIIVCAVLMGRPLKVTREATRRTTKLADNSAHSHVSENELEYVVFDNAQIIPCYVVHLDLGVEEARQRLKSIPLSPNNFQVGKKTTKLANQGLWPAEVEEIKAAKKAAAAKWFPYGYGPAKGTSFVIEEIGETSDDEENYGEYQGERIEVEDEVSKWQEDMREGSSWFDEYQKSRVTWDK
jgi:hypothetical protein